MIRTPNSVIIRNFNFDAFFFLRYFRIFLKIFVPLSLIIIFILILLNLFNKKNSVNNI